MRTFVAEKLGLPLGGGFAESTTFEDVLSWRPQTLLPYRDATTIATTGAAPAAAAAEASEAPDGGTPNLFHEQVVAASTLAQTLSDFGRLQLQPEWLRPELAFARANLSTAVERSDVDLAAALVDVLRSFGVDEEAPQGGAAAATAALRVGVGFLLQAQQADGSWPSATPSGPQAAYHPTCSALLALSPHEHHGFGPSIPRALRMLRSQAGLQDDALKEEL